MPRRHSPREVMPAPVASAVGDSRYWFVIGGQAVRCFCPYRPSRDVDFGVSTAKDLESLLRLLRSKGRVEITERDADTVHLSFDGIPVSAFVLPALVPHVEERVLTVTGLLATKLHAILDRGTRRDFFDLYVLLQSERLGIIECIRALRTVYATEANEGLLLRALVYFDDAEAEAKLPGEGPSDWKRVKAFFEERVGALLVPPGPALDIQGRVVEVRAVEATRPAARKPRATGTPRTGNVPRRAHRRG
jgi:hypothetical protein